PAGSSITVASVRGVGNAPLYVAQQQGLFRQAGLAVHIHPYPSVQAELQALRNGAAGVAVGDYANFFYAQEQDNEKPMVVLADGYDARPDIMGGLGRPDSPITPPRDLTAKT